MNIELECLPYQLINGTKTVHECTLDEKNHLVRNADRFLLGRVDNLLSFAKKPTVSSAIESLVRSGLRVEGYENLSRRTIVQILYETGQHEFLSGIIREDPSVLQPQSFTSTVPNAAQYGGLQESTFYTDLIRKTSPELLTAFGPVFAAAYAGHDKLARRLISNGWEYDQFSAICLNDAEYSVITLSRRLPFSVPWPYCNHPDPIEFCSYTGNIDFLSRLLMLEVSYSPCNSRALLLAAIKLRKRFPEANFAIKNNKVVWSGEEQVEGEGLVWYQILNLLLRFGLSIELNIACVLHETEYVANNLCAVDYSELLQSIRVCVQYGRVSELKILSKHPNFCLDSILEDAPELLSLALRRLDSDHEREGICQILHDWKFIDYEGVSIVSKALTGREEPRRYIVNKRSQMDEQTLNIAMEFSVTRCDIESFIELFTIWKSKVGEEEEMNRLQLHAFAMILRKAKGTASKFLDAFLALRCKPFLSRKQIEVFKSFLDNYIINSKDVCKLDVKYLENVFMLRD